MLLPHVMAKYVFSFNVFMLGVVDFVVMIFIYLIHLLHYVFAV